MKVMKLPICLPLFHKDGVLGFWGLTIIDYIDFLTLKMERVDIKDM